MGCWGVGEESEFYPHPSPTSWSCVASVQCSHFSGSLSSLGKRCVGLLRPTDLGRGPEASGHSGHQEHPQPLSLFLPAHSLPPTGPFLPATWQTCLWAFAIQLSVLLLVFNVLSDSIIYCSN